MNIAVRNARRLVADARLLLKSGSPATAVALAALAIEEHGKVSILRGLAVAKTDQDVKSQWRDYRSHVRKNAHWIFPRLVLAGARQLEDFRTMFDQNADHPQVLDHLKQLAVYSDCLAGGRWSDPALVIDFAAADPLLATAELLTETPRRDVTAREVELWIEHMGPVWGGPMEELREAFRRWTRAMEREGLLEQRSSDEMDDFLGD